MREEFRLIEKLSEYIADLRNGFLSIDAVVKLYEKGKYDSEASFGLIKGQLVRIEQILDELRVIGF